MLVKMGQATTGCCPTGVCWSGGLEETRGKDPIHPNGAGYAIMAEAFLSRWAEIGANAK